MACLFYSISKHFTHFFTALHITFVNFRKIIVCYGFKCVTSDTFPERNYKWKDRLNS